MPTFRIYYAEIESKGPEPHVYTTRAYSAPSEYTSRTEWEDEIEAEDPVRALELFFREHAPDRHRLAVVDEEGEAHPFEGWDFDPDATYIWTETALGGGDGDHRMLEYQGIDEATPGMVTCPLCNGHGEVNQDTADEFDEVWGDDEEEDEPA